MTNSIDLPQLYLSFYFYELLNMPVNFKNVIKQVKLLNAHERALGAHCLISSLETEQDEGVDLAWAELAEKRYNELISRKVKPVSWESKISTRE